MIVLLIAISLLFFLFLAAATITLLKQFFYSRFVRQQLHEWQNLRYEFTTRLLAMERMNYDALPGKEEIVYDGRDGISDSDFTGTGSQAWDYVAHRFSEGDGEGSHNIHGNTITINRTNTSGRYELYLKRFAFDGKEYSNVPANTMRVVRRFCLRCEIKKGSASHILRFVFKGEATKEVLDEKDYVVFNPDWQKAEIFFAVTANEDCLFRIDDLKVMDAPGNIQIRNLVLVEKR